MGLSGNDRYADDRLSNSLLLNMCLIFLNAAWEAEPYKIVLPFNESHLPFGTKTGHVPFPTTGMLTVAYHLKENARLGDNIGLRTDSFMECGKHDSPMCYLGFQKVMPSGPNKKMGKLVFSPVSAFAITPTPVVRTATCLVCHIAANVCAIF